MNSSDGCCRCRLRNDTEIVARANPILGPKECRAFFLSKQDSHRFAGDLLSLYRLQFIVIWMWQRRLSNLEELSIIWSIIWFTMCRCHRWNNNNKYFIISMMMHSSFLDSSDDFLSFFKNRYFRWAKMTRLRRMSVVYKSYHSHGTYESRVVKMNRQLQNYSL